MAAGWMRHLAGDQVDVYSGGSDPAAVVNPMAVEAMAEVGIDIAEETPRRWDREMLADAAVVVTMGCGDECPVVPGSVLLDWPVDDPSGQSLEGVRSIRDEIKSRVEGLISQLS